MQSPAPGEAEASEPSYIDYELFLDPSFSASKFANTLVLSTNNPTDTPLDLSTPLSRVLFDIQEVDSHIHNLTSTSALPLLTHTQSQTAASSRIVTELSSQAGSLNDSYQRLEKEVVGRYEAAEEVRQVSERLWHTVRLGRAVGRALQLGRQLEVQMGELQPSSPSGSTTGVTAARPREDHRAMVRASNTILALRALFEDSGSGGEGEGLSRVLVVNTLNTSIIMSAERSIRARAQQMIREFSMSTLSGSTTYGQTEDTKSRTTSALVTLYLLSPLTTESGKHATKSAEHVPELMITALQDYLRTALTSSGASLTRGLGALPTLDRALVETAARCQNIIALEMLLDTVKPPPHPFLPTRDNVLAVAVSHNNLLQPLLNTLETGSLASYFWRTLASNLSSRVQDLLNKGGVQARTLRSNKNAVRDAIKDCVVRGSQAPAGAVTGKSGGKKHDGWEREVAVMVSAVVGHLGR
ncbi:MAG: hypothetical protein M1818_000598 [Claussenomyces sp. TS43310]|nr:MAG: hypothetical protein M1818_000598 [Claussenomyces sp. TS43310]